MKKSNLMTSPPRCSYSSVMIETIFDFKFYIDKILSILGFEPKTPGLKVRHSTVKLYTFLLFKSKRDLNSH